MYVLGKVKQEYEEYRYKVYVTDCLQAMAENTANFAGGMKFRYRWADIIDGNIDTRTAEEVVHDVINNSGLKVID